MACIPTTSKRPRPTCRSLFFLILRRWDKTEPSSYYKNRVGSHNGTQTANGHAGAVGKVSPPQSRRSDATMVNMNPASSDGVAPPPKATKKTKKPKAASGGDGDMGASTGTGGAPAADLSSMQPMMQDSGSIAAPGAHSSGYVPEPYKGNPVLNCLVRLSNAAFLVVCRLSQVPIIKKVFRHPNHDAHR